MPGLQIKVHGLAEIEKALADQPKRLQNAYMRGGMRAAIAVVRDAARATAPSRTGKLRKKIVSSARQFAGGRVEGNATSKSPQSNILEFGSKPHLIKPRKGKALKINGRFVRAPILNPGIRPRNFMGNAGLASVVQASQAFYDYVMGRLAAGLGK